jgi:type II secretory pathway pseudopilin PulG
MLEARYLPSGQRVDGPEAGGGGGFSLIEILIAIGVTAVVVIVGIPMMVSYYHNAQNTAGAQHVRTLLNQARQIAIDDKALVCVLVPTPTQVAFVTDPSCSGPAWRGSITDAAGNIRLQPGFTVSASANPVFDYLGRALPPATYTVTNSSTGSTLTVTVATSGRITIP